MPDRIVTLVRHGHYDPITGSLTTAGRKQARLTADAIAKQEIDNLHCSTMPRARQTAEIMRGVLRVSKLKAADDLCEIVPAVPHDVIPGQYQVDPIWVDLFTQRDDTRSIQDHVQEDLERASMAYTRLFVPSPDHTRHDVVVCHGTLIRYFICRVLDIPHERWTRMGVINCGISRVLVFDDRENMTLLLDAYNDTGHLPTHLRT